MASHMLHARVNFSKHQHAHLFNVSGVKTCNLPFPHRETPVQNGFTVCFSTKQDIFFKVIIKRCWSKDPVCWGVSVRFKPCTKNKVLVSLVRSTHVSPITSYYACAKTTILSMTVSHSASCVWSKRENVHHPVLERTGQGTAVLIEEV